MKTDTVALPPANRGGRPHNLFSMSSADFKEWKGGHAWSETYERLLAQGGASGLTNDGLFLLDLTAVFGFPQFLYTRLRSADNSVDFSFPGVMRREDVGTLIQKWELHSERPGGIKMNWTHGPFLHLSGFPLELCRFPGELARPTPTETWMLVFDGPLTTMRPLLAHRGGWSTLFSKRNNLRRLGCVMGTKLGCLKRVLNAVPELEGPGYFPSEARQAAATACLATGADYFAEKCLTPQPGKALPWMPHAQLLGIDSSTIGELSL